MSESAPVMLERVRLKGLPASAFQHPLDRQATENLKKIKGFDWLIAKFLEFGFERIDYITNIGGCVRVGPKQMVKHYSMLKECCEILDVDEPELYVMQGGVNAFTSGNTRPYIVLQTRLLEVMDDAEVMAVIAHELGHIKCGHQLYQMMARTIKPFLEMSAGMSVPVLGAVVGSAIESALLNWSRRAELSSDRAALLAMQDAGPCVNMLMKLAGGTYKHRDSLDPEQFLNQARAYQEGLDQSASDRFYRFIVNMTATHPFAVERARLLDKWVGSKQYQRILKGEYTNPADTADKTPICPNTTCAQSVLPTAKFCDTCGTPLRTR